MAFPTALVDLDATRGSAGQKLNNPNHVTHHTAEDDTIESLQAKVGIDASAVTTSFDYKLSGVTGTDKAVSKTGTETLTNKTLTSPVINQFGTASGVGAAWQNWTPTYTSITIGNGTVVAKYIVVGTLVSFYYKLTFGSTTSIDASNPLILLPVSPGSNIPDDTPIGHIVCFDNGTAYYYGQIWKRSSSMFPVVGVANVTYVQAYGISSTIPMTWTTGDYLLVSGTYEAA